MIEQKIKVLSESLARGLDRREFLRRAGGVVVSGVVALVMGPTLARNATRVSASPLVPLRARCSPPGPFCNLEGASSSQTSEPTGCRDGHCFQHVTTPGGTVRDCVVYYQFYPGTGCWTTIDGNGYWTCCDCTCGGANCGCAKFSRAGGPNPY
ncbi:MAG: hypothetical protein WCD37_05105 [Chloroflexia bacterium]